MATKTGWGLLNYTRSKDVADRQVRNLAACLRAGQAERTATRLTSAMIDSPHKLDSPEYTRQRERVSRAWNRRHELVNAIPSRDSAMY